MVKIIQLLLFVGIPGLEPGMTGPESVVLPLHHIPRLWLISLGALPFCVCKDSTFSGTAKTFLSFFSKNIKIKKIEIKL